MRCAHGRFGEPRADARAAARRAAPRAAAWSGTATRARAEPREDLLTADLVAGVVRLYAYVPQLAAMLPMNIARGARQASPSF